MTKLRCASTSRAIRVVVPDALGTATYSDPQSMRRLSPSLASTGWADRADAQALQAVVAAGVPGHRLVGRVHRDLARGVEVDGDVVRAPVGGAGLERHVGRRPRDQLQVVRQHRREEGERQLDAGTAEDVDRAERQHGHAPLGQRRDVGRQVPHDPEGAAVDSHQGAHRMRRAGPVRRRSIREAIGRRPDGEVGIVRDERDRRRPERGLSLRRRCDRDDERNRGEQGSKHSHQGCGSLQWRVGEVTGKAVMRSLAEP